MVGYFFNLHCKGNYFYLYIFMDHKKTTVNCELPIGFRQWVVHNNINV